MKELRKKFTEIKGSSDVNSALKKVQAQVRPGKTNIDKANKEYDKALKLYKSQIIWRAESEITLKPGLSSYLEIIGNNIGARQLPSLTRDQALYLAKCNAVHRDISLNF